MSDNQEKKPKRTNLSIDQRIKILQRLEAGEVGQKLADEYKVTKSAISLIKKRKKRLLDAWSVLETYEGNMKKKRYKGTEDQLFEKQLYMWFVQQRNMGFFISGTILRKQALLFNERLGRPESFKASHGWLDAFKKRHGIKCLPIHKKDSSVNCAGIEDLKDKNTEIVNTLDNGTDHIYNCDKNRRLPKTKLKKTFVGKNERIKNIDDSNIIEEDIPTVGEALRGLKTFIKWYQKIGDGSISTLQTLRECHQLVMTEILAENT